MRIRCDVCGSMIGRDEQECSVCGMENPDYEYENECIASEEFDEED